MRLSSVSLVRGLASRMWAVSGIVLPLGSAAKSGVAVRLLRAQHVSAGAVAADHRLLLVQRHPVPELDEHPDDPADVVGAADRPLGLTEPAGRPTAVGWRRRDR